MQRIEYPNYFNKILTMSIQNIDGTMPISSLNQINYHTRKLRTTAIKYSMKHELYTLYNALYFYSLITMKLLNNRKAHIIANYES